jgi:hypothetical protein
MCLVVLEDFSGQACQETMLPRDAKKWVHELGFLYLFHAVPPTILELLTCKEEFDIVMP